MITLSARTGEDHGPSAAPIPGPTEAEVPDDEHHAWNLGVWWDVYFTSVVVAMGVVALLATDPPWRWPTAGLMAAVVAVYFLVARPLLLREERGRPVVLMVILLLLCLPAVLLSPTLSFLLVAVAPLCFMTAGTLLAVPTVGLILMVPGLVRGLTGENGWDVVTVNLLVNGVILGFSLWFGRWFERIVEQSYERAELIRKLRESRVEAARLSEKAGAMAERERLAREMHDTLAQGFAGIITLTQAVESEMDTDSVLAGRHLALMRETAAENLAEARAMVAARRPVALDGDSLEAALERTATRLGDELGASVDVHVRGASMSLSNDLRICLLRTAQEALANVRRHSGAEHVEVTLECAPGAGDPSHGTTGSVRLTVSDDGSGFRPDAVAHGNGLANMRHRAGEVDGVLEIDSAPGPGTTIRMWLPLPDDPRDQDGEEHVS